MLISENWLRQRVNIDSDTSGMVQDLMSLGLEVGSVTPAAGDFSGVIVGKIISAVPHPNADRLRCCQVDVGDDTPLDIVCGGVNAREGITVAVATVGAVLPGNFKIKATKIRGQSSSGMICSSSELGLGDLLSPKGGIMELPHDIELGLDVRDVFDLDDNVLEIELTPNRGDCASLLGVARELAALNGESAEMPYFEAVNPVGELVPPLSHLATRHCPRYVMRLVSDIDNQRPTPIWMSEILRRSGIRSINAVVDVLNYVMLEIGQPMHAFDYDKISGCIQVRLSQEGEVIQLLDGEEITLDAHSLVIADDQGPLALAGIMGGQRAAVSESTKRVLLESAYFDPVQTRVTAAKFKLKTDSSYRFERGVDHTLQRHAIERASFFLSELVDGPAGPVAESLIDDAMPTCKTVSLRHQQIQRVLGIDVAPADVVDILSRLGFVLLNEESPWLFRVPTFRFDIDQEVDLIEELARVVGYGNIPSAVVTHDQGIVPMSEKELSCSRLSGHLVSRGFSEAITYSFVDPQLQKFFVDDDSLALNIQNPISSELSQMRTSLWPGLISAMRHNINRQQSRVRLFEFGRIFTKENGVIEQPNMLGILAIGYNHPLGWTKGVQQVDFFSMKADVMSLLSLTHTEESFQWVAQQHHALHPGQSAALIFKGRKIGFLGSLHPRIVSALGLNSAPILFEVQFDAINKREIPAFSSIPKFPSVKRDIAIVLDEKVPSSDVCDCVSELGDKKVSNVEIFDIYQGQGVSEGKKSLALGLTFFDPSRTLIDSEVDDLLNKIIQGLGIQFKATLRA